MKIEQSSLQSEGKALAWQSTRRSSETSLSITLPERRAARPEPEPATRADISSAGLAAAQQSEAVGELTNEDSTDPRLQLLIAILEAMTGRKIELFNGTDLQQPQASAEAAANPSGEPGAPAQNTSNDPVWSVRITQTTVHEEMETARYSARGQVTTADGRQIDFSLDLAMQRYERQETSTVFEAGNAPKRKDPLVLNLSTDQVRLQAEEFSFDLNADGKTETLARLAAGSAFLALDRNGNGKIDNGSELFGPSTGDGFEELAALDQDGNGWIDENDAAFGQLQVWRPDEQAQSLKAANVGAIALDRAGTAFTLKAGGETAGAVRTTGLFLSEDGVAKTLQQIDLVV
ncbi:VCBS repeat-containing protein [Uliginosibacterium sp. 31-16]|uniref:VCBS repeat-containing protein n=1 Tax=Uliginosibacterium sp. 31-16 TaxID=3068315 RepID=UPI00273F93A5|nr:VCBS repeat-containing protein [Uliginosibacterium sp. 31-16]MDP5240653.1 VCBS repeat-containing protein [Uliginosibacterium sp. 31-16]